jgi:hypothetical protein
MVGPDPRRTSVPPTAPASPSKTAAYGITLGVRDATPAANGRTSSFAHSTIVHDGDVVSMQVTLHGKPGAAQSVHISFAKGPSKAITVTAEVPGGTPQHAEIRSAIGSELNLERARYDCNIPPTVTFCPPQQASDTSAGYSLVFPAGPLTPVLVSLTNGRAI